MPGKEKHLSELRARFETLGDGRFDKPNAKSGFGVARYSATINRLHLVFR